MKHWRPDEQLDSSYDWPLSSSYEEGWDSCLEALLAECQKYKSRWLRLDEEDDGSITVEVIFRGRSK